MPLVKLFLKTFNKKIFLDKNKDDMLSLEEFESLTADKDEWVSDPKMEMEYRETRRREFRNAIDQNNDGLASIDELLHFVDPSNDHHADSEAKEILLIADLDNDKHVNEAELLAKSDLLLSSGFIQPRARLHDDL